MKPEIEKIKLRAQKRFLDMIIAQAQRLKDFPEIENHEAIKEVLQAINKIGGVRKWLKLKKFIFTKVSIILKK